MEFEKFESETLDKILPALIEVQKDMEVIPKNGEARIPGRPVRNYATIEDVFSTIKRQLYKHGIFLSQPPIEVDGKLYIYTILRHASKEFISGRMELIRSEDRDMQKLGSQMTYVRRYSLLSIMGVVADEDDDGEIQKPEQEEKVQYSEYISEKQVYLLKSEISRKDPGLEAVILKRKDIASLASIKKNDFNAILDYVKGK